MFHRSYMEYHADRFTDISLLVEDDAGKVVALFPASQHGHEVVSHGGLSFGGMITDAKCGALKSLHALESILEHFSQNGFHNLRYKAVPHIYSAYPAEEDLYAITRLGGQLVRRDISSTIALDKRLKYGKGRKWSLKRADQELSIRRSDDFVAFMEIESQVLVRHGAVPTHSAEELVLLAGQFPDNIQLFGAFRGEEMIAGVVTYQTPMVFHTQYIGATDDGKESGALDRIIDFLIEKSTTTHRWFDFGISTEQQGLYLNEGLAANKESYGARGVVLDHYDIPLNRSA